MTWRKVLFPWRVAILTYYHKYLQTTGSFRFCDDQTIQVYQLGHFWLLLIYWKAFNHLFYNFLTMVTSWNNGPVICTRHFFSKRNVIFIVWVINLIKRMRLCWHFVAILQNLCHTSYSKIHITEFHAFDSLQDTWQ